MTRTRFILAAFGAMAAFALMSAPANAGPNTSYIFATSQGTQPSDVGTITLAESGANTVIIDLILKAGYGIVNTGGPHTPFAFDLSGMGPLAASVETPTNPLYASKFSLDASGGTNTPYGYFPESIDYAAGNGSKNAYYGDLKITLSRPSNNGYSGLDTANFIANANGIYFSADLTNGQNTGSQAWLIETPRKTPEPWTLPMIGSGLALLAVLRRRSRIAAN